MKKKFAGVLGINANSLALIKDYEEYEKEFAEISKKIGKSLNSILDDKINKKIDEKEGIKQLDKTHELMIRLSEINILMNLCQYKKNL